MPFNPDYNGAQQDGISYMQYTIRDGIRHSTAAAFLREVAHHPNLRVVLRADARRLLFDGTRCVGVEWVRDGALERRHAGEILVCAGTIGSPQLLMLSGVGPADHLADHGIAVVADLPGVGANLHDHLLSPVIFSAERAVGPPAPGLPACQTHLFGARRAWPSPTCSRSTSWSRCTSRGWKARRTASRSWAAWSGRSAAARSASVDRRPRTRCSSTPTRSPARPTSRASSPR